jgi:hypothetical protein
MQAGHTILVDPEDLDLLSQRSWHPIHHSRSGQVLASCGPRPRKANVYLHRLIWERMGNSGPVRHDNANGLDCRRANLVPGSSPGLRAGIASAKPAPSRLGLWRHAVGAERPARVYDICATEHDQAGGCPRRDIVGVARRAPEGWQARLAESARWSPVFPRFYDAMAWLREMLP